MFFRKVRLDEILEEIEKYCDSDESNDDYDEQTNMLVSTKEVSVYISPPDNGSITDEDSGDEDTVTLANLPGNQMTAAAEIKESPPTTNVQSFQSQTTKCRKIRHWKKKDLAKTDIFTDYPTFQPTSADLLRSPAETFGLFIDEEAVQHLTAHTIGYAAQSGNHQFFMSCDEMRTFIGILLLSGYCSVSRRRLYWGNEPDTHNILVVHSMRRNRFDEIMSYFHAADNSCLDQEDKFAKIRPFLNIVTKKFLLFGSVFGPDTISIDESMVPYFGRHPVKQFIRGKPIRWGYKAWVAATRLGYVFSLDFYQGKYRGDKQSEYRSRFGLGGEVVLDLVDVLQREYEDRKFSLYFDNFFTSLRLLDELQARGHGATGTIRSNRVEKCPVSNTKTFSKQRRGSEEHFLDEEGQIILVRWCDNGVVSIASNQHGLQPIKRVERYCASEKKKIIVQMPKLISKYNENMGGVDRVDENIEHYRISVRGKKWYFPILTYLFNVCANNAWLFARQGGYNDDLLTFTRSIAQAWLKQYGNPPKNDRRLSFASAIGVEKRFDNIGHFIAESNPKIRQRCKTCLSNSIYFCVKCDVFLHPKCFLDYHSKNQ